MNIQQFKAKCRMFRGSRVIILPFSRKCFCVGIYKFYSLIFISRFIVEKLSEDELIMCLIHEYHHTKNPFADELTIAYSTTQELLKIYSPRDILLSELNYRILHNYGVDFEQYKTLMFSNADSIDNKIILNTLEVQGETTKQKTEV